MLFPTWRLSASPALYLMHSDLPSLSRQSESNNPAWIIVCVVLAAMLFLVVTMLVIRFITRARQNPATLAEETESGITQRRADRERLVFAYLPAQAPAIVRMQRLAKKAGLSTQELDSVAPVSAYARKASDSSDLASNKSGDHVCAVCLEEMVDGSKTRRLPCGHWFDADCISVWATKANRCPVCNTKIIDEKELERSRLGSLETADHSTRQSGRRSRGGNAAFELAIVDEPNFLASVSNVPPSRMPPNLVIASP
ncbi:unnamed protein product [Agarophyton chilense]